MGKRAAGRKSRSEVEWLLGVEAIVKRIESARAPGSISMQAQNLRAGFCVVFLLQKTIEIGKAGMPFFIDNFAKLDCSVFRSILR